MTQSSVTSDFFPSFSAAEYERRHERLRRAMGERGLDCLVVYGFHHYNGNDVGQTNVVWLAGFANVVQSYVVFPVEPPATLVVGLPFHLPVAKKLARLDRVVADPGLVGGAIAALQALPQTPIRIGLVGYYQGLTLPYEHRQALAAALPDTRWEDVTGWFHDLRLVMSSEEADLLRRAGALSDRVHDRIFEATRPGVTHAEVCRLIGLEALGAGGHWALSHVGSTPMTSPDAYYPDFYATCEPFRVGDLCQTEIAVGYGNYLVKTTCSYFIGTPTPEYRRLFHVAAEIQNRCIEGLMPGMTGADADVFTEPAVREGLRLSQPVVGGFGMYNTAPWAGAVADTALAAMCRPFRDFVFEPGHSLFVIGTPHLPGTRQGLWVGQTCLMTESGLEPLGAYAVDRLRVVNVAEHDD